MTVKYKKYILPFLAAALCLAATGCLFLTGWAAQPASTTGSVTIQLYGNGPGPPGGSGGGTGGGPRDRGAYKSSQGVPTAKEDVSIFLPDNPKQLGALPQTGSNRIALLCLFFGGGCTLAAALRLHASSHVSNGRDAELFPPQNLVSKSDNNE